MPSVLTIGNFDGVHLGHRAILDAARRVADDARATVKVLTFDPHPAAVLRDAGPPPRIASLADRVGRLREAGADEVMVLEPTDELLGTDAADFVRGVAGEHRPVAIVEGEGFRFGKSRRGDLAMLRRLGDELGFAVEVVPAVPMRLASPLEVRVSSTLVRRLVGHGRVRDAASALGRPFTLEAPVARGEQRGRAIGVPTANLDADAIAAFIVPADGVYAAVAELVPEKTPQAAAERSEAGGIPPTASTFPAAVSIGVKPTFGVRRLTVEAHLLGYAPSDPDALYGRTLRVSFARWLRDQYAFPGVDALRAQLRRDVDETRRLADAGRLAPPPTTARSFPALDALASPTRA